jgi:hypothetical protein
MLREYFIAFTTSRYDRDESQVLVGTAFTFTMRRYLPSGRKKKLKEFIYINLGDLALNAQYKRNL